MEMHAMGRVDLPYLHAFEDRYGRMRYYYRRGGRRQPIKGAPGSPEFTADYQRIHDSFENKATDRPAGDTFGALVTTYYAAPEFWQNLEASTQAEYKRHIEPMRQKWCDVPLIGITRRVCKVYRDSLAKQPPKANSALRVMKTLLNFAVDNEMITVNPAAKLKPLRHETEGWKPWPEAALTRFADKATGSTRMAFFLALYTGQRRADVLAMRWDAITADGGIMVKQGKKGEGAEPLWIPLHPILQTELERVKREHAERVRKRQARKRPAAMPMSIVCRENGQPYTEDGFGSVWNRAQHDAECAGLPFHGLRKNATGRLFENGCTPQEVQAITGHETLEMVAHYGRGANQKRMAKAAMDKLTNGRKDVW